MLALLYRIRKGLDLGWQVVLNRTIPTEGLMGKSSRSGGQQPCRTVVWGRSTRPGKIKTKMFNTEMEKC